MPTPVERVGDYELVKLLGRGSMGLVYLARKSGSARSLALKLMTPDQADSIGRARFDREAKVMARVTHPGLVAVVDAGEDQGRPFYVMDFVAGETLKARIARGPLPVAEAARLVRALADAAAAAHRAGVVHRDLKPANVILDAATGAPRITDFGLARDARAIERLTRTGDTIGTPLYMAPEQVRGESDVDARVDVYALGLILFECIAGTRPFDARTPDELGRQILGGHRASLRRLAPATPPALEAIAKKASAVARADRYPSAEDLRDDLDRFLRGGKPLVLPAPGSRVASRAALGVGLAVLAAGVAAFVARSSIAAARARAEAAEKERQRAASEKEAEKAAERARRTSDERLAAAEAASRSRAPNAFELWGRIRENRSDAAQLALARFYLRRNHANEAVEVARPLAATSPEARSVLARALLRAKPPRPVEARAELEALARTPPPREAGGGAASELAHLARARLALLDGKPEEARREAKAALGGSSDAEAHTIIARALTAGYESAFARARAVRESRNEVERRSTDVLARAALEHADRAVSLAPDDVEAITTRSIVRLAFFIYRWYALDSMPPAPEYEPFMEARRRDLDDAIELASGEPLEEALVCRGRYRYFFPQTGEPREDLDAAIAERPDDVEALALRALCERSANDAAIAFFRRAFEIDERRTWNVARHFATFDPARAPLILDVAAQAAVVHRRERGAEHVRAARARRDARIARATEAARDLVRAALDRAANGLALDEARAPLDRARALAPDDPVPILELARILAGRSRLEEALGALDEARTRGADPIEVASLRGEVLLRAHRLDEAKTELGPLVEKTQGAARLLAEARLARASGETERARDAAQAAVRAAPSDADAHLVFAETLFDGDVSEPDPAMGEALWAVELEAGADVDALFLAFLGRVLGLVAVTNAGPELLQPTVDGLRRGFVDFDKLAPCARFHATAGLALIASPARANPREAGKAEIETARKLDPEGFERLSRVWPELAKEAR
ncbi:MAG TPA: protein kinase [Planctomycetota bacterium]|nr:protein kinase [Planctomycetota bacterium]